MADRKSAAIARLNDLFRRSHHPLLGYVCITAGVIALGDDAVFDALMKVSSFDQFTEDNDPWGERDFGQITVKGERLFWKIDYFSDERMVVGSKDPADPSQTFRVLTIMLVSEW